MVMKNEKLKQELDDAIDNFLSEAPKVINTDDSDMDCSSGVCIIKPDKSILERINKKIITEDGRQLLI